MAMLNQPIAIGNMTAGNRVFLAPLAGVSDPPFRRICQEFGAGLTYVEMLSAAAVIYGSRRTLEMMTRHPAEPVLGVQLTGPDPETIARAIRILDGHGFDTIDINMGCSVRKIVAAGWGCALVKDPRRVAETAVAARAATSKPLSVKTRLGYTADAMNIRATAQAVACAGVDMFTVHGRFRTDEYSVAVRYAGIAEGLQEARTRRPSDLVLVGNGDIMDLSSARAMVERTGCDAVMVSRGALGNPWIFREILKERTGPPSLAEWCEVVLRHIQYHEEFHGENLLSAMKIRKHLIWYASGFPRTNRVRGRLNVVESMKEAREVVQSYTRQYPPALRRYEDADATVPVRHDPKYEMDRAVDRGVGDDGLPIAAANPIAG